MKEITIPLLNEKLLINTGEILESYDLEGVELEYPWLKYRPRTLFAGVFIAAGIDGIACSFCSEVPKNKLIANHRTPLDKISEDDCVSVFIQPAGSENYYAWEINSEGNCHNYRAPCGEKNDELKFDYELKSQVNITTSVEDEFWYLNIFIPWTDFSFGPGFLHTSLEGQEWRFTCNRIDNTGMENERQKREKQQTKIKGTPKKNNPGLQTLVEGTEFPSFHQNEYFAAGRFQSYEKIIQDAH